MSKCNENRSDSEKREERDEIIETGSVETKNPRGNIHCISIIGQIEGHTILSPQSKTTKYEHVLPKLVQVEEEDTIDGLLILLNTAGGDVEAGLAIAEMIAGMKKPTVSIVLGGGHSIGVPLAVSARLSFIAPSATMTIHPMRMNGEVIAVMQTFEYLQKMQDRIIKFITRNSKIEYADFKRLMLATDEMANDVGTVLYGEEAAQCGLIDRVGGLSDALEALFKLIKESKSNADS